MNKVFIAIVVIFLAGLQGNSSWADKMPSKLSFSEKSEQSPLVFDDIEKTIYEWKGETLKIKVNASSSGLIFPLAKVYKLAAMTGQVKFNGRPKVASHVEEKTKDGDDFPLRIGIILHGKAPTIPFFAPAWIKALSKILKHPAESMHYFVLGSQAPAGVSWLSPYSDDISHTAIATSSLKSAKAPGSNNEGWQEFSTAFDRPMKAVGINIIADGDNSKSTFTTELKNLNFKVIK